MTTKRERGSVLVTVAISLLLLMGIAALAIDGGMAYNERRFTQGAADNAALAGAWAECQAPGTGEQAALDSAQLNGFSEGVEAEVEGGNVTVAITSDVQANFGRTQGLSKMSVASKAVASCTQVPGGSPYALFTGSRPGQCSGNTMELSSGNTVVNGAFHTNNTINSRGNQTFTGYSTYVSTPPLDQIREFDNGKAAGGHGSSPELDYPVPEHWKIESYAPGGQRALAAGPSYYHPFTGYFNRAANSLAQGLHYIDGDVNLWGSAAALTNRTIVATGTIQISVNIAGSSAYESDGLLLFANGGGCHNGLQISASNGTFDGTIFVPNGKAGVNTSQMVVNGGIFSFTMNLAGSNNTINGPSGSSGPPTYSIQLEE